MRTRGLNRTAGVVYVLLLVGVIVLLMLGPVLAASVSPILIEIRGNATCSDLTEFGFDATNELKSDPPANDTLNGPGGMVVTISNFDGKTFDWTSNQGIDAVFVKAGNAGSYLYVYAPDESFGDTGLTSPGETGNAISHISFCYDDNPSSTTVPSTTTPTTAPSTTTVPSTTTPTTTPPSTTTTPSTTIPPTTSTAPELLGELGDYVWFDDDGDGLQGEGESGVAGVTVLLFDSPGISLIDSTVTDVDGWYVFPDLPAGEYIIEFVKATLPEKHLVTEKDSGDEALDSDGDLETGRTVPIDLGPGEIDHTWDLGIVFLDISPTTITSTSTSIAATTIATTPETLPVTGLTQGAVAGLAAALLAFGSLAVLAVRRRDEAAVIAEGWSSRLWDVE